MDYGKEILSRLIDIYERRGAYNKDACLLRAIQVDVRKIYPAYTDRYNHDAYMDINAAIEMLRTKGFILAEKTAAGQYSKIKLNIASVPECYRKLKRTSIPEQCEKVKKQLAEYRDCGQPLLKAVLNDWFMRLKECRPLPYDIKYDSKRAGEIARILQAVLSLTVETYIRNFSTALFKDSKRFQKEFRSTVESILFDYTDETVEKSNILSLYNLYENPTYVMIKGSALIRFDRSVIDISEMPDGIALSNASLENIRTLTVNAGKVITVENLTTYHDSDEKDAVHIYLGGYHNRSKQALFEKIYAENKSCSYFHKGDPDVYGFLILENLKEKTGIPFKPLMMDVATIERFYKAGLYKKLTAADKKIIEDKKNTKLAAYADALQFMLDNDCKVEQESVKALELTERL